MQYPLPHENVTESEFINYSDLADSAQNQAPPGT